MIQRIHQLMNDIHVVFEIRILNRSMQEKQFKTIISIEFWFQIGLELDEIYFNFILIIVFNRFQSSALVEFVSQKNIFSSLKKKKLLQQKQTEFFVKGKFVFKKTKSFIIYFVNLKMNNLQTFFQFNFFTKDIIFFFFFRLFSSHFGWITFLCQIWKNRKQNLFFIWFVLI